MFTNCIPVMCTKNNSVIAVKKWWRFKLLGKSWNGFACLAITLPGIGDHVSCMASE